MRQENLNKILNDHKEWLEDNKKGTCADLCGASLCGADLRGADLRGVNLCGAKLSSAKIQGADLRWADLRGASLCGADLRGTDLRGADLRGADLCGTDLRGADLRWADLRGATMPEGIYTAGGAGNKQRYTYYDALNDRIICGCWDDGGNHLDNFKKRIEDIYGPDGKEPNPAHYKAYRAAIKYFEACREAYDL